MKRIISTSTAAAGAVLLAVALAPGAAYAVTNPADNPHEITVKGDDGRTYVDGQDTLPGYDDEACTYIPGARLDFANNRVHYADGQSIPWTEWDRATGYAAWKAKQDKPGGGSGGSSGGGGGGKPAPTKTTKAPDAKPPTAGRSSSGGTSAGSGSSSNRSSTSRTSTTSNSARPATDATTGAGVANGAEPTATSGSAASATREAGTRAAAAQGADDAAPTAVASGAALDGDVTSEVDAALTSSNDAGGRGAAGVLILVALAALGALAFAGRPVLARVARKGSAS